MKISAEIANDKDRLKYERKLLKYWIQSFLLGVPKIVVGFRSQNGILQRLEELETKSIPMIVKREGKGTWDGNLCINFTAAFLDCEAFTARALLTTNASLGLRKTITSKGVWRIRRRERSSVIEVYKNEDRDYGDILSLEFIEWRNRMDAKEAITETAKQMPITSSQEICKPHSLQDT